MTQCVASGSISALLRNERVTVDRRCLDAVAVLLKRRRATATRRSGGRGGGGGSAVAVVPGAVVGVGVAGAEDTVDERSDLGMTWHIRIWSLNN